MYSVTEPPLDSNPLPRIIYVDYRIGRAKKFLADVNRFYAAAYSVYGIADFSKIVM